jgi:phosphomevalonate kinase
MSEIKKENKHTKHNKKRKVIGISLYAKDRELMKKKFGKVLNANEAKRALLTGECMIITKNIDPEVSNAVVELKRVGNNLNQIAFLANAKKEIPSELILLQSLKEIKGVIKHIRELR